MFDLFLGLPVHILVIHAVVVLAPLSALVAVVLVARPQWHRALRWPLAIGGLITGVGGLLAATSGEALLVRVSVARASTTNFSLVQAHVDAGNRARLFCLAFMAVALAAAYLPPRFEDDRRRHAFDIGWRIVLGLAAVGVIVSVVIAGDAGARAVWSGL